MGISKQGVHMHAIVRGLNNSNTAAQQTLKAPKSRQYLCLKNVKRKNYVSSELNQIDNS